MKILFAHGLESEPHGRKYHALVEAGHDVIAPDGRGKSLGERVEILTRTLLELDEPVIVVGSSFGGIAGLLASIAAAKSGATIAAIILCAPALGLADPETDLTPPAPTAILHGRQDEIIPIATSRAFAARAQVRLVEVDDDHRLAASLEILSTLVTQAVRDS